MSQKNYLPFVQRLFVNLPTFLSTQSTTIGILTVGMGERLFLGDLNIHVLVDSDAFVDNYVHCRIGYLGKGFLLEKRIPCGFYVNKGRPGCSVWKFPKPYRLKPTEQLYAQISPFGAVEDHHPGIMFNGKRLKDNLPISLYDSTEAVLAANATAPLANETLRAPDDSEIELYSVSTPEFYYPVLGAPAANEADVRVWGPDRREWLKWEAQPPGLAIPLGMSAYSRWLAPPSSLIELGEDRGWVVNSDESLIVELEAIYNAVDTLVGMITLRGSLEVTNG